MLVMPLHPDPHHNFGKSCITNRLLLLQTLLVGLTKSFVTSFEQHHGPFF